MGTKALRWERRPDERPQEILDAALAVFAERGYRNTRLEDIGEAAGVTKGAIYHYFANKEDLLLRAIEQRSEEAFGRIEEILRDKTAPVSTRLRLVVRRWFGSVSKERLAVVTILLQGIAHEAPDAFRRWLASGPAASTRLIATLVREGQARESFGRTPMPTSPRECWFRVCCSRWCGNSTPRPCRMSALHRTDSWIPRSSCSFTDSVRAAEPARFGSGGDPVTIALVAKATNLILPASMQFGVLR